MNLERELTRLRAPDEPAAQQRAWEVVASAYRQRSSSARRAPRWRFVVGPVVVAVVVALTLTPAGATVERLVSHVLGVPRAARALSSLPTSGRLLVSGPGGTWIVSGGGSRRRLGSWQQASWSPHGLYVAVASGEQLAAVTPLGHIQWVLSRPDVADPRWYPPTGFRVAYLSGRRLRVVAGDGTGDHLLASGVAAVAPAWRPGHPYQLAYVRRHRVVLQDADSGRVIWTRPTRDALELNWSSDGDRLAIITRRGALVLAGSGHTTAGVIVGQAGPVLGGSLSPSGRALALIRHDGVVVARLGSGRPAVSSVLSGAGVRQVAWSPNGRWLLASWPAADQWVFVAVGHRPRLEAVSRIAHQFAQGPHAAGFPRLDGWCCTTHSPPG